MSCGAKRLEILPADVKARIDSAVEIICLEDVVEELFRNALDAHATEVEIVLDFKRGFCSVQDNGFGIPASELAYGGNLANRYCTSKTQTTELTYGRRGCFLSCLKSLSLLSITSRHVLEPSTNSIVFYKGEVISRAQDITDKEAAFGAQGTKVTAYNLFGNMPVRLKQQTNRFFSFADLEKAFQDLRRVVIAYILALPRPIEISMRDREARFRFSYHPQDQAQPIDEDASMSLPRILTVFGILGVSSVGEEEFWKLVSAKAGRLSIRAAICLNACPTRKYQFMSFGPSPISSKSSGSVLYELINNKFHNSMFGATSDEAFEQLDQSRKNVQDTAHQSAKLARGLDRWPAFYIRVDDRRTPSVVGADYLDVDSKSTTQAVLQLLQTLVEQFLDDQQLCRSSKPVKRNSQRKENKDLKLGPGIVETGNIAHSWGRVKSAIPIMDRDLLKGLPFVQTPSDRTLSKPASVCDDILHASLTHDEAQSLGFDTSAPTLLHLSNHISGGMNSTSPNKREPPKPGSIDWEDPRTGRIIHLNAENGFVLPVSLLPGDQETIPNTGTFSKAFPQKRSLCYRTSSKADIAARVQRYLTTPQLGMGEPGIPQLAFNESGLSNRTFHHLQIPITQLLNTVSLRKAQVLKQVDRKFILAISNILIVIDQHAADERIKVEKLYQELCSCDAISLSPPITFEIVHEEANLLTQLKDFFASWCIHFELDLQSSDSEHDFGRRSSGAKAILTVTTLPSLIAERCRMDPKVLIEMLRREIWSDRKRKRHIETPGLLPSTSRHTSWLFRLQQCPKGLIDMMSSRACRTSIMFNDDLTNEEAQNLVYELSKCQLPFQCAHGRPNVISLTTIGSVTSQNLDEFGSSSTQDNGSKSFGKAFDDWM